MIIYNGDTNVWEWLLKNLSMVYIKWEYIIIFGTDLELETFYVWNVCLKT